MGNIESTSAPLSNNAAIQKESARKNEEDVTLIWYDERQGDQPAPKEALQEINDYILLLNNKDQLLHYISSNPVEQIFVVLVLNDHSDELIFKIHPMNQIHSIFLYSTIDGNDYPRYSKVVGCFPNQLRLMDALQKKIKLFLKQTASFNSYDEKKQITARDLTEESGSFLFLQLFKHITMITGKTNQSKQTMLAKCRAYYHGNDKYLASISLFERTYRPADAIAWYTKDTFVHRLINKALRTEDIDALFTFQFFITDISSNLKKSFESLKKPGTSDKLLLYRGLDIPDHEIKILRSQVGKLVSTNGYVSTSRSRTVAVMFANQVLMEIEMDLTLTTVVCADIADRSVNNHEEEVLFDMGAVFEMVSCGQESEDINDHSNANTILVFKLKATDRGSKIATDYIEYQKKRISQSDITLMFGCLLVDMGQYQKSSQYFRRILHERPNDEKVACIYSSLARTTRLDGRYEHAVDYYQQAYQMHIRSQPPRFISAARALNGIGIVYSEQHDYHSALENFDSSLKLYRRYRKEDEEYAGILNNVASVYCSLHQLAEALKTFKKVKKLYDRLLPTDHPNRAATLINIGNVYYEKKDYMSSLHCYMASLRIKQKILPMEHQDKIRCLDNIGLVHYQMRNYQQAHEYFRQALTIAEKTLPQNHPLVHGIRFREARF